MPRGTMAQRVADEIRRLIGEGLAPGDRLPSERDLGSRLGIGRSTLREAMRLLESDGVVMVRRGRGAFVNAGRDGVRRGWHQDLEAAIDDLLVVRLLLEPAAAALAANRSARSVRRAKLKGALAMMAGSMAAGTLEQRVAADVQFHRVIAELAGNRLLEQVLDNLNQLLTESRRVSLAPAARLPGVHQAHAEIAEEIIRGNRAGASAAMTLHLLAFAADMGLGSVEVFGIDCADFGPASELLGLRRAGAV